MRMVRGVDDGDVEDDDVVLDGKLILRRDDVLVARRHPRVDLRADLRLDVHRVRLLARRLRAAAHALAHPRRRRVPHAVERARGGDARQRAAHAQWRVPRRVSERLRGQCDGLLQALVARRLPGQ